MLHILSFALFMYAQPYPALKQFPYLFVKFYRDECTSCDDLAPTWEALGEVITDTAMHIVDEHMDNHNIDGYQYADDEYESAVNAMAPVLVTKLNCSLYPSICNAQGIRAYPTMRIFVDGEARGDYNGHRTVMELVHWLSHIEAEHRVPDELKMHKVMKRKCFSAVPSEHVNSYMVYSDSFLIVSSYICLIDASDRTVRNEEEKEWNDALMSYRSPWGSWNTTLQFGCQLTGHIMVDKAPGKFLIHAQSYGHVMAPHMTNLSHIVHHFSFGDADDQDYMESRRLPGLPNGIAKSLHPMDDNVYVTGELHQAYHHHLRVIATDFRGKVFNLAREKVRRVYRILCNSQLSTYREHIVPEAKFSYDLSPISVSYVEESRHWYDYITGVLAIVGGTFTVVGMLESSMGSLSSKKKRVHHMYQ